MLRLKRLLKKKLGKNFFEKNLEIKTFVKESQFASPISEDFYFEDFFLWDFFSATM